MFGKAILLCGAPRTGTSWTAKVLSLGPSIRYLREPIMQGRHEIPPQQVLFRYLTAGDEAPEYASVWRTALSLRYRLGHRWLLAETRKALRLVPFWPARLLVKEVSCPLALEWLAARFDMHVAITIRHPCGYVASGLRLKSVGDPVVELEQLLAQPALVALFSPEMQQWLTELKDPVARMAAGYGMVYKLIAQQLANHPEWTLIQHETLCEDPPGRFRRLFEALNVRYLPRVDRYLAQNTKATNGHLYSLQRKSSDEPDKWKQELTAQQIETVAGVIERFRLPFYREFA